MNPSVSTSLGGSIAPAMTRFARRQLGRGRKDPTKVEWCPVTTAPMLAKEGSPPIAATLITTE